MKHGRQKSEKIKFPIETESDLVVVFGDNFNIYIIIDKQIINKQTKF